jgi:hypothetical protein
MSYEPVPVGLRKCPLGSINPYVWKNYTEVEKVAIKIIVWYNLFGFGKWLNIRF